MYSTEYPDMDGFDYDDFVSFMEAQIERDYIDSIPYDGCCPEPEANCCGGVCCNWYLEDDYDG